MLVEQLDQLGEVGERPGQAVDLIDDDDVDLLGPDLRQQPLQRRAVERGAGERAVIVAVVDQAPALMRLALDVGLAGLALRVERVEFEVEIMLGRFAGVDRAAQQFLDRALHGSTGAQVRGRDRRTRSGVRSVGPR